MHLILRMKAILKITYILGLSGLVVACADPKKEDNNLTGEGLDRKTTLIHLVDNVVVPSYQGFKIAFDSMHVAVDSFAALPTNNNLQNLRSAWVNSYVAWQRVELFDFGIGEQTGIINYYNLYPTDVTKITANINNPSVNLELPVNYDSQGFPALDYLINGLAASDDEIVALYSTDADAQKRLNYLKRLCETMNQRLNQVMIGWTGESREKFISKTGIDIGSSFSNMANGVVRHYEKFLRSGKIGYPSGALGPTGNSAPELVEAFYKKNISKQLAITAHQAAIDFFNGKNVSTGQAGPSFKTYLDAIGATDASSKKYLSTVINEQFQTAQTSISGLNDNFYEQITTNNAAMTATFGQLQKTVKYLKVDMTSAMSITITYTDNDGD